MLALLVDEHIPPSLIQGLTTRQPLLDVVSVRDVGMRGMPDAALLEWAAAANRVIVTFDRNTVTAAAYVRIAGGEPVAGAIVVDNEMSISQAIEELLIIIECCRDDELHGQVWYVPLR